MAGNITGCTKFGKPGQGGTFDTVQTLQAQEAGSECVVLEITDFRQHFTQVYRESSVTQSLLLPGWCEDPKLSDEWIVVCLYSTGAGRGPFEHAQVWFCEIKDGEERHLDGYQASDGLVSYFLHWPERLRQTLLTAAATSDLNTLSTEEAHNLRRVDVDNFRSAQFTLLKQDPDRVAHYMGPPLWKILRAMQTVLQASGTSLGSLYPWTADLPAASSIVLWRSNLPTKHFGKGEDAARFNSIHLVKLDRAVADAPSLQRLEQLFLRDQHFFNACVFEFYDEFVHGNEKPEYEESYVYGAFTIQAHKASLPDEAIVVKRYLRPGCSPRVAFPRAQISGFDNVNGDVTEHYKNLRKLLWFWEGSSRRFDSLLYHMLQRVIAPSNLMWSIDPHARSTFVPNGALINRAMRAHVSGIEMKYGESAQANVDRFTQDQESRGRWRKVSEEGKRRVAQLEKLGFNEETAREVKKDLEEALESVAEQKQRMADDAEALARGLEREREILLELFRQDEEAMQLYGGDAASRA
ncbi:hypothetical protein CKM354_000355700 [Cercospora kikuchii]|nr:uncharacterized protein CKM354_000355700 [Cercospora kikuchii]GIZ40206.1 hypothetical protein CKM354_000355700 [Cercospora kikuchii]